MEALRVATVLISGVYAGAVVLYLIVFPSLFALIPGEHGVRIKRRIDPLNDKVWPPFLIVAMVCAVLLLVLDDPRTAVTVLTAVALAGLAAVAVVTRALVIPVNKRIHALDAESTSPDTLRAVDEAFRPLHRRWAELHAIRMLCALTSFVCFTLALALA